jgi:pimeloyl-ACP methyl ester carboxylesterase
MYWKYLRTHGWLRLKTYFFPNSMLGAAVFGWLCLGCSLTAAAQPSTAVAPDSAQAADPTHAQTAIQSDTAPKAAEMTFRRSEVVAIIANSRKVVSPRGIEELIAVQINGIPQYLSIRGKDLRNPILLFIHGGPASPEMPADYTFQTPWEDYFTVVEWDQRGTGKTYAASDPAKIADTLTIPQMTSDAIEVIRYLRTRFLKQKIFVMGHSWGTVLGIAMAHERPEWLYAYIGVGQVVNMRRSEAIGFEFSLRSAAADHNEQAVKDLESLAPYPGAGPITLRQVASERKWLEYYGGLTWRRRDFKYDADAWTLSPDYSEADLDAIGEGSELSLNHLLPALGNYDIDDETDFNCPIVIFDGRHDYSVSHELSAKWFARVHAPYKRLVWFEESAHMMFQEQPGRFLEHLLTDVRPFAVRVGDVAPDEAVETGGKAKAVGREE